VMKLILGVCEVWKPECVIITSNLSGSSFSLLLFVCRSSSLYFYVTGSKEMMEGCKQAGYPAFGTLFDF